MTPAPHPSRWTRLLAASGLGFAALTVLGAVAFPMPPGGDVSPASKPLWLAAHQTATITQSYVRSLADLAFILFALVVAYTIRRRLDRATILPTIALVGGVLSGSLLLLAQATNLSAVLESRSGGSAAAVHTLGSLSDALLTLSSLPAALLFGAAGIAFLRTRVVPSWLAYLTLAGMPFAVLDAASYDGGPLETVGFLGVVYFLIWTAVTSIALLGKLASHETPAKTPALA